MLSDGARALAVVLGTGHGGLQRQPHELAVAGQARDQILACLQLMHAHLFAGLPAAASELDGLPATTPGSRQAVDLLEDPVAGLGHQLRRRRLSGLRGPSPTDLALRPPAQIATRGWVAAASALDGACVQITGTRPHSPQLAWVWERAAPPGAGPDPSSPPQIAWALAADLAALAGALTVADENLTHALLATSDPSLLAAGLRLRDPPPGELRVTAGLALRLAESGQLPSHYQLQAPATDPIPVTTATDVPAALDQAVQLLLAAPTLTGPQQRGMATCTAAIAGQIAALAPPQIRAVLDGLALASVNYAATWATSPLAATDAGDWRPVEQTRAVAHRVQQLLRRADPDGPDAGSRAHLLAAVDRLPGLTRAAMTNLRDGLAAGSFLVPPELGDTEQAWAPADRHPIRRRAETAAFALQDKADEARLAIGPKGRLRPTPPEDALPARERFGAWLPPRIARLAGTEGIRPTHPALPPTPRPVPRPGRPPAR